MQNSAPPSRPSVHFRHIQQAAMLYEAGQFAEAKALCGQVLKADRRNLDCLHLLSTIAIQDNDLELAADLLGKAVKIAPQLVDTHYNLGLALSGLGRHAKAVESYVRVLSLEPGHLDAIQNYAASLYQLARYQDALDQYERLTSVDSGLAQSWDNRGLALAALGRDIAALESHERAIALRPHYAEAHHHRGCMLYKLKRLEDALESYDRAIQLKPNFAEAHSDRGGVLMETRAFEAAVESFDRAIVADDQNAGAHINKAHALLHMGRMKEGWAFYEWRKKTLNVKPYPQFSCPLWLGAENIAGKTLLIHAEQGLGDTIQFCRYAALAAAMGIKVVLAVQEILVDLISTMEPSIEVVSINAKFGRFDYFVPLLSMPMVLGTTTDTIPGRAPYLHPPNSRVEKWKRVIGENGFKVAICWQGSPGYLDQGRSFPLAMFDAVSRLAGVRLFSIQKMPGSNSSHTCHQG